MIKTERGKRKGDLKGGDGLTQMINHCEACLKREITRLYKAAFGKGPEETTVKIFDNIVFIKFSGGFSPLE